MRRVPWLVWAAIGLCLPFLGKAPAIDEESYLWMGSHLSPLHPYDWQRVWQGTSTYAYAHPPLFLWWMWLFAPFHEHTFGLRIVSGLPFVALYAWAASRLARRLCNHPDLAELAWITSATVLLGLHDSLEIDLPMAALLTAGVAAYREGFEDERWFPLAGFALGLAIEVKYTAVVFLPVLLVHMIRRGWRWPLVVAAAVPIVGIELFLYATYREWHPVAVWAGRHEIAHGDMGGRWLGVLARAALLPVGLVLIRTHAVVFACGVLLALGSLAAVRPQPLDGTGAALLLTCAALGSALLLRAVLAAFSSSARRRKGDRDDALLLGGWFISVVMGVVLAHNYASARYLLPASVPAAILLARAAEDMEGGKLILRATSAVAGAFSLLLAIADYRYARAGAEVGRTVSLAMENEGLSPGRFAGEWSFRHAMERAGWTRFDPAEVLPTGMVVAIASDASPGDVDKSRLVPMKRFESRDNFPVRVVDIDHGVGLYAETLGPLPFSLNGGPLESVSVYRVGAP